MGKGVQSRISVRDEAQYNWVLTSKVYFTLELLLLLLHTLLRGRRMIFCALCQVNGGMELRLGSLREI